MYLIDNILPSSSMPVEKNLNFEVGALFKRGFQCMFLSCEHQDAYFTMLETGRQLLGFRFSGKLKR